MAFDLIFGPVSSGRLGLSLGLDLLGAPICTHDCLYCEVGPTEKLTLARKPYVPAERILTELAAWAEGAAEMPDYVTLGGMGEPCLNSDMGRIIEGARRVLPGVPVAVLTNSCLMADPEVRAELALADVVLPSMDTLVEAEFHRLNRSCPQADLKAMAEGLLAFRREFKGKIYLEILLAAGENDSPENLALLRDYVTELAPDRVDVVTMTRPGAHAGAKAVDRETLGAWRGALGAKTPKAAPRVRKTSPATLTPEAIREIVLASLSRRPQTPEELSRSLGIDQAAVNDAVDGLVREELVVRDAGYCYARNKRTTH